MPLFFFDIHNDIGDRIDDEGHEFLSLEEVRREAQRLLPDLARHELSEKGARHFYVVMVRDGSGHVVYSATLTYSEIMVSPGRDETLARLRAPVIA